MQKRLIIAMTGASGVQYGLRLLEVLEGNEETHLVLSQEARELVEIETETSVSSLLKKATFHYEDNDFLSPIASGSYRTLGMVVAPCSMKTLSEIANGIGSSLVAVVLVMSVIAAMWSQSIP